MVIAANSPIKLADESFPYGISLGPKYPWACVVWCTPFHLGLSFTLLTGTPTNQCVCAQEHSLGEDSTHRRWKAPCLFAIVPLSPDAHPGGGSELAVFFFLHRVSLTL